MRNEKPDGPALLEIINDPQRLYALSPEEIPPLLGELERLKALLWARLTLANGNGQREHAASADRRLNVEEAAAKVGVSKDWLYRHGNTLTFTIRVGRSVGFSEQGIERWLRQRAGR